jgi:MauM/NapG family ferredoxin protein
LADDPPFNRRSFFRHGLRELLRPLSNAAAPLEEMIRQLASLDIEETALADHRATKSNKATTDAGALLATPIRPPGALPEQKFRETCSRCGECVKVCPVQCIRIDSTGVRGAGAPFIDIDTAACALCDGLLCMNKCPSGALLPTPIGDIDMGTAVWNEQTCLRSAVGEPPADESCTTCIDVCPIGEMAIFLDNNKIKVKEDGCTGCGMCQNRCPTRPRSIVVNPKQSATVSAQPRSRRPS